MRLIDMSSYKINLTPVPWLGSMRPEWDERTNVLLSVLARLCSLCCTLEVSSSGSTWSTRLPHLLTTASSNALALGVDVSIESGFSH